MILDGLLLFLVDLIDTFLSFLPATPWPSWLTGSGDGTVLGGADWMGEKLSLFSAWVNLELLMTVGTFLLGVKLSVLGLSVSMRVYALLRGSS
jgi:hypothetical protein